MYEFKYLPTPTIIGVEQKDQIDNKVINILNTDLLKFPIVTSAGVLTFQIEEVILHGRNTLDAYSDVPVYLNDILFEDFANCVDGHKEIIKELTQYFKENKNYGLDITKNIILNATFLGSVDGLNHMPLNAIYIIQGQ